jgi:uncharacterized membrane protein YqjE
MDRTSPLLDTPPPQGEPHLLEALQLRARALWTNARCLVRDHTLLALLEVQRASIALVKILGAAVIISVLVVSAWMAIITALVVWAVGAGMNIGAAIIIAAVLNLIAAGALAFWIKAQIPELLFAATMRQLKGEPPPADEDAHG